MSESDAGRLAPLRALGMMSGTSMDGIDAAVVTTDGVHIMGFGPAATYPYDPDFRDALRGAVAQAPADAGQVAHDLTLRHADAVRRLLKAGGIPPQAIDVIGFHGHTVLHRPEQRLTMQIGDGQRLANETGITVVEDFRSADVALGGHGAPLASLFHAAMAEPLEKPLAVLNIGGVANVTWIAGPKQATPPILAFDTGPGNALVDDWVRRVTGQPWDERGRLARGGRVHKEQVTGWLQHPFFKVRPPKSLDRDSYAAILDEVSALSAEDGAATLTAFTVFAVVAGQTFMPEAPRRWLVCGGGRRNSTMMGMLADALSAPVAPVEVVGWDGDALEAQAFAFLAARSLRGMPLSLPTTTGVSEPITGGVLRRPARWD